ncbi:alkaline phosphatase D family protein [Haladaptatus sp. DFWS20]|uniref:alkaline phosphatase D family protein n=1 Tax=Haladaptatus sp. DFWS20 TaxID=3403467 RepID=UPI003EB99A8B
MMGGSLLEIPARTKPTTHSLQSLETLREQRLEPVAPLQRGVTRPWIGPAFWGNRLQDWRLHDGRIECVCDDSNRELRTVGILTRHLVAGTVPGHISVRTGIAGNANRDGFCGLLLGVGNQSLDYRAAALAQRGSGTDGGFLCTFERDGGVRFREHTDERRPLRFAELPSRKTYPQGGPRRQDADQRYQLNVDILPERDDRFTVHVSVREHPSGVRIASATRRNVPGSNLSGGISLVSSPPTNQPGARWWFDTIRTGGAKIAEYPERTFGPIAGTLYSVNETELRLTAQLMPVGETESRAVQFQYRPADGNHPWRIGDTTALKQGYTAPFRLDEWDSTRSWEYRIVYDPHLEMRTDRQVREQSYQQSESRAIYRGRIAADPGENTSELTIGLFSCVAPTARWLEAGSSKLDLPRGRKLGRYTHENIYFPYTDLIENSLAHDPDILAFVGDQIYQSNPTKKVDSEVPMLDYLYKWYLWLWAFNDLTRDRPAIVLTDDHDVYQSNLWGERGRAAPSNRIRLGGYARAAGFIELVQQTQCSHNPDPYDIALVRRDISTYYTAFRYGGVDFAVIEDRKFKTSPHDRQLPNDERLLGRRQTRFLRRWANDENASAARICFMQTTLASLHTTPSGRPEQDYDTSAYPKQERDAVVGLLQDAGALSLCGDQHLATLARHGIETNTDGIVQFAAPACATLYQRWFEPNTDLPNGTGTPHTGDFTDAFGNRIRMLAVANPKLSFEEFTRRKTGTSNHIGDRRLKREGYGIVRVNHETDEFVIECWPYDETPTTHNPRQFPGWPYRLRFDSVRGEDS